jgi:hypothetical protein
MLIEPSESDGDGSLLSDGSVEEEGDGVAEEMEVAEKEARLGEACEEGRREGLQGLGPGGMGMKEMDELEEQARRTGGAPHMEGGGEQ